MHNSFLSVTIGHSEPTALFRTGKMRSNCTDLLDTVVGQSAPESDAIPNFGVRLGTTLTLYPSMT